MKILIVSGFLGAGKTTFIRALSQKSGREFAILENEYGETGVDAEVLKGDSPENEVNIWELTEGCICCSTKQDFAASVLTIANTVDPEILVVEPTGVGMLSNIIRNLRQIEYERIALLSPVTIVDGRSFMRYRQEYPSIYADQIREAGTVFVSHMEDASPEELSVLREELSMLSPRGELVTEHYSRLPGERFLRLLQMNYDGTLTEPVGEAAEGDVLPDTFSMNFVSMDAPEKLFLLLEGLIRGDFGDVLRAKGFVRAGDGFFRFDLADGRYMVTGAGESPDKEGDAMTPAVGVVFIGTNLRRQAIRRYFYKKRRYMDAPGRS